MSDSKVVALGTPKDTKCSLSHAGRELADVHSLSPPILTEEEGFLPPPDCRSADFRSMVTLGANWLPLSFPWGLGFFLSPNWSRSLYYIPTTAFSFDKISLVSI